MGELSENEDLNLPLLSTEAKVEEHSKGEIAQRTCNKTAKIVLFVWSLAAILVLVLLTLEDAWDDLLANTRDIFQDIRSSLQERPLLQEEYRAPHVFSERHDFLSGSDLDVADETADDDIVSFAARIGESSWDVYHQHNKAVFVLFYDRLGPQSQPSTQVWEEVASRVQSHGFPLGIASVDCQNHQDLCGREALTMFPSLRWYEQGHYVRSYNGYEVEKSVEGIMLVIVEALRKAGLDRIRVVDHGDHVDTTNELPTYDGEDTVDEVNPNEVSEDNSILERVENSLGFGSSAENLTAEGFKQWLEKNPDAFVNLYASWCSHCKRLAPTWEKFAQEVKNEQLPLGVGKVDCSAEDDLCRSELVLAFPTLRWYHNGERVNPDYMWDRTVEALLSFAQDKLASKENEHNWEEVQREESPPLDDDGMLSGTAAYLTTKDAPVLSENSEPTTLTTAVYANNPVITEEPEDASMDADAPSAPFLTEGSWAEFHESHDVVFVNFCAPWPVWCQLLAPIWDEFSQRVSDFGLSVAVIRVDCTDQADLCRREHVLAFPTLQWYESGRAIGDQYTIDRSYTRGQTLNSLLEYTVLRANGK